MKLQFVANLKRGVKVDSLTNEDKEVLEKMKELGIVVMASYSGKKIYRLSNNVKISRTKDVIDFEVRPNSFMGVFFDYDDVFEITSDNKNKPRFYCISYELNPMSEEINNFGLGNEVRVKVLARGFDYDNEGLLVKLPASEENYYKMETIPYITTGISDGGKSKNTSKLQFNEEVDKKFIVGKKGYFVNNKIYHNIREVKESVETYELKVKNDEYSLEKISSKKINNR